MALDFGDYQFTLTMNVEFEGRSVELGQIRARLPVTVPADPRDLLDAFTEMLCAGSLQFADERVLFSGSILP